MGLTFEHDGEFWCVVKETVLPVGHHRLCHTIPVLYSVKTGPTFWEKPGPGPTFWEKPGPGPTSDPGPGPVVK